tara:strand:- start:244 stop:954 length:711 start_codon:yes stop_codon:yes gene_type:complete
MQHSAETPAPPCGEFEKIMGVKEEFSFEQYCKPIVKHKNGCGNITIEHEVTEAIIYLNMGDRTLRTRPTIEVVDGEWGGLLTAKKSKLRQFCASVHNKVMHIEEANGTFKVYLDFIKAFEVQQFFKRPTHGKRKMHGFRVVSKFHGTGCKSDRVRRDNIKFTVKVEINGGVCFYTFLSRKSANATTLRSKKIDADHLKRTREVLMTKSPEDRKAYAKMMLDTIQECCEPPQKRLRL